MPVDFSIIVDKLLRGALGTTNQIFIIFIILTGFIFLRREAFGRTFLIFAFTIILCPFLKSLFKIPLPPTVNADTWAFPSGHMMASVSLWTWLAWEYKNKFLSFCTTLLLAAIGFALVHFGYHYPTDVFGALFFGLATLFLYNIAIKRTYLQKNPPLVGFILAIIAIPLMLLTPKLTKLLHIWGAFGALVGFTTGWFIGNKLCQKTFEVSLGIKIITFIIAVLGMVGIEFLFNLLQAKSFQTHAIRSFVLALWLSCISQCICSLIRVSSFRSRQISI